MLRFQLPQGIKLSRKFLKTETIQTVCNFLHIHFSESGVGSGIKNFALSTNYPKKQMENMEATLEAEGLHPRGMLFVQDLDA